jgi:hypothetical protein
MKGGAGAMPLERHGYVRHPFSLRQLTRRSQPNRVEIVSSERRRIEHRTARLIFAPPTPHAPRNQRSTSSAADSWVVDAAAKCRNGQLDCHRGNGCGMHNNRS